MIALRDPIRLIPVLFLAAIAAGTLLLWLPISKADGTQTSFLTALFTSTSAIAVTGLIVEDTATYWSLFGQIVILAMFQIGGFGIMTAATLFGLLAGRGFDLRSRMATKVERNRLHTDNARGVLLLVLSITLIVEGIVAVILATRLVLHYDYSITAAIWHGAFHSISAFNNAGFSIYSDNLMGFQSDAFFLVPIMIAIIIPALGFPVMEDLRHRRFSWRTCSLHTRITLIGTVVLLLYGFFAILAMEWDNPGTIGAMSLGDKMLNAAFHSVVPRTAGFNSLDVGSFHDETLMTNYLLMFIGGGSAGTAGGVKITTAAVLAAMVFSEIARHRDASILNRRIGQNVQRQALSVVTLSLFIITIATTYLATITPYHLQDILFECISAFSTVGLSTGMTHELPPSGQLVIIALMFIGRVGTITVATALALGSAQRSFRYPEENPIVG